MKGILEYNLDNPEDRDGFKQASLSGEVLSKMHDLQTDVCNFRKWETPLRFDDGSPVEGTDGVCRYVEARIQELFDLVNYY